MCCLSHGELPWHFQNHIQGWMNNLNMLLLCFREKMLDDGRAVSQHGGRGTKEGSLKPLSLRGNLGEGNKMGHNFAN